jgi:hypothetical protein
MPYLPMSLLCKLGKKFLGFKELAFNEVLKNGRKFYNWMVLYNDDGTPIKNKIISNGVEDSFNGLNFVRYGLNKQETQIPPN